MRKCITRAGQSHRMSDGLCSIPRSMGAMEASTCRSNAQLQRRLESRSNEGVVGWAPLRSLSGITPDSISVPFSQGWETRGLDPGSDISSRLRPWYLALRNSGLLRFGGLRRRKTG